MLSDTELIPARGTDTVEILENDHQTIKGLLKRLTAATDMSERKATLEQLKGVLTVHNATEENIVYPAIEKLARGEREAEHLYHETAEADVVLFELDNLLKEGHEASFIVKAEKFREAVLHHIENEEGSAFPHLRENTDARQSKNLTQSVRTFRESLHFEP